jgi:hypothetical protein
MRHSAGGDNDSFARCTTPKSPYQGRGTCRLTGRSTRTPNGGPSLRSGPLRRSPVNSDVRPHKDMGLLDLLVVPEAFVGCVLGLLAAGLIHWIAPAPEPIVLEGGLVAAGFIGGLVVNWLTERRSKDRERR